MPTEAKLHKIRIVCPFCFTTHSRSASPTTNYRPTTGDYLICTDCGQIAIMDDSIVHARKPSRDERVKMAKNPHVAEAKRVWLEGRVQ